MICRTIRGAHASHIRSGFFYNRQRWLGYSANRPVSGRQYQPGGNPRSTACISSLLPFRCCWLGAFWKSPRGRNPTYVQKTAQAGQQTEGMAGMDMAGHHQMGAWRLARCFLWSTRRGRRSSRFRDKNFITGRYAWSQRDELFADNPALEEQLLPSTSARWFDVNAYTIGYTRDLFIFHGAETGWSTSVSFYLFPTPSSRITGTTLGV